MIRRLVSLLLILACAGPALAAPKTDVIHLRRGDRLTGEIIKLERGQLTVKTDDLGTVNIKWHRIARMESIYWFQVATRDGRLVYGQMPDSGVDEMLRITFQDRDTILEMHEVVGITKVKYNFMDKVDFSIDLGVSSYKSTGMSQFTADTRFAFNGRINRASVRYYTLYAQDKDDHITRRQDLDLVYDRILTGKLSGYLNAGLQRNEELGIKARILGGLGVGYRLLQGSSHRLDVSTGLSQTREWATSEELVESNTEAVIRTGFSIYLYESPKTTLDIAVGVMPALTGDDRIRTQVDADIRQEIFKDFFVGLKYYERSDSNPPPGAQSNTDWGVAFAVGWSK